LQPIWVSPTAPRARRLSRWFRTSNSLAH
jgi:hypothetical protein